MPKILKFKSCAVGGEFTGFGITPNSYGFTHVKAPNQIVQHINNSYASDAQLSGKVTGIGYGWQQYTVPSSGKIKFTVRGAAGGSTGTGTINPITGAVSGNINRPGRGAKLIGETKLKKGDILYILVGMRGWCNNGNDWGSGGGGASVVLLDNPSGGYTFAPLNRKVDVLFVAGGGGGCFDSSFGNAAYYGTDATTTNGINTNGGSANGGAGGAGLTGNGANGSGGIGGPNLLSGNPTNSNIYCVHAGGWGGGGFSYDGGGGGAGYSGGHARGNGNGGNGGTSFINPSLVTEISRGYATVAEDSERNLTNPWTAYGFVELELGRDDHKFILAHDSEGYKYFDGPETISGTSRPVNTNQWQLLSVQTIPEETTYIYYGNTIINNRDGLLDDATFLVMSNAESETLNISGNLNRVLIEQNDDVSISDVSLIKTITATMDTKNLDIRFAVSKNNGISWQTYNMGTWKDIDIHDKGAFGGNGYALNQFSSIPIEAWNNYKAKNIRFAFIITQNGANGNTIIDNIKIFCDLVGSWRHFKESEATYEYISDTELRVTFLDGGNYKVNYLDQLNAGTGSN